MHRSLYVCKIFEIDKLGDQRKKVKCTLKVNELQGRNHNCVIDISRVRRLGERRPEGCK